MLTSITVDSATAHLLSHSCVQGLRILYSLKLKNKVFEKSLVLTDTDPELEP